MSIIIGIDLGTTNSEVAVYRGGRAVIIEKDGDALLPSFAGLSESGELLVGHPARNQYVLCPERTVKSIKRKMGSDERIDLGGKSYTPPEISAMILAELKERAQLCLGERVERAVITVPAYFTDAQRHATKLAGEIAGLEVVRIINEPTAAALTYETDLHRSSRVLVYDLGGGTFDASLIQIQEGVVEVLASHGNNRLGGDDFDGELLRHVAAEFQEEHGVDLLQDRQAAARLTRAVEEAKKHLSTHPFALIEEEAITRSAGRVLNISTEIRRDDYEDMIRPYIDETIRAIATVLRDGGVSARELDKILLVGGATRTPLVAELIEREFGVAPSREVNPDLCVALGASIQAALIEGQDVSRVLVDITPYTFGTSALGELDGMLYPERFVPLIRRNSALPASMSEVFYTLYDRQEAVDVEVYQGEDPDALKNILIGKFVVEGLSAVPAGNEIVFHMDLDINGILNVTAEEKITGLNRSLTIKNAFTAQGIVDLDSARERLRALLPGREPPALPAAAKPSPEMAPTPSVARPAQPPHEPGAETPAESRVLEKARSIVERARRILESVPPEDRDEVVNAIEELEERVAGGDEGEIMDAAEELKELLFYLE